MSLFELFVIALGLSMDAFAVSICKGLCLEKMDWKKACLAGVYFGGFQALMPLIGYYIAYGFREAIEGVDHWVAFVLLCWIGITMIRGSREEKKEDDDFGIKAMLILAVATSIDALAVGISFAFLDVGIWQEIILIGVVTFILSTLGVKVGNVFGSRYKSKAEVAGGIILILIGLEILLKHLGIL